MTSILTAIHAAHELGHAYACLEADLPVYGITLYSDHGETQTAGEGTILTEEQAIGQLVMLMAGQQAAEVLMNKQGLPWTFTAEDDYRVFDEARASYFSQWRSDGLLLLPEQGEAERLARELVLRCWGKIADRIVPLCEAGSFGPGDL